MVRDPHAWFIVVFSHDRQMVQCFAFLVLASSENISIAIALMVPADFDHSPWFIDVDLTDIVALHLTVLQLLG